MALFPRDEVFFTTLNKAAENLQHGALTFEKMLESGADRAALSAQLGKYEHEGDLYTHEIIDRLNRTFITPIDREDIHGLAVQLDDVLDAMDQVAGMIETYKVREASAGMRDQAHALTGAVGALCRAVGELNNLKNPTRILDYCHEVSRYEKQGDKAFLASIGRLFEEMKDPIELIKQKEIHEVIELALDKAEDAANVIEGVVVKHA